MQRKLTAGEVSDLLNRNFDLQAKVLAHGRIVDSGQWDQIGMNESVFERLPIPTKGLAFQDDKFGVVVVFPDAKGELYFSGEGSPAFLDSDVNKPPYESPSGNTFGQMLADLKNAFGSIVAGVVITAVVYHLVMEGRRV